MQVHSASVLTLEGFPKSFWPFVWLLWPPNYPFHWVNLASPHGRKTFFSYPFRISMDCRARLLTQETWLKLEASTRLQSMGNKPGSGDWNGASQILAPPWPQTRASSPIVISESAFPHILNPAPSADREAPRSCCRYNRHGHHFPRRFLLHLQKV